jgi:hypothetical protein
VIAHKKGTRKKRKSEVQPTHSSTSSQDKKVAKVKECSNESGSHPNPPHTFLTPSVSAGDESLLPQAVADAALARAFYATGVSPNILLNKHFVEGLRAVAMVKGRYTPPGVAEMTGPLLQREKERIGAEAIARRAAVANLTGVTLVRLQQLHLSQNLHLSIYT